MKSIQALAVAADLAKPLTSARAGRGNRRAGVGIYQNMVRILFALREARLAYPFGKDRPLKVMTPEQICDALSGQDDAPSLVTVRKYLRQLEKQEHSQIEEVFDEKAPEPKKGQTYWRLKESSPLNKSGLSDVEAALVCVASQILTPLVPPDLRHYIDATRHRAEQLLFHSRPIGVLPPDSPLWMLKLVNRVWVERPPAIAPKIQQAVFEAVRLQRQLSLVYCSMEAKRRGEPGQSMTVWPLRLVQQGDGRLYLIGTPVAGGSLARGGMPDPRPYRHFALHRITEATLLDKQSTPNPELQQLVDSQPGFGWQGRVRLVARIHPDIALRLQESPLNDSQLLHSDTDGWHRLEVTLDSNWELRWWILSNGRNLIVLDPPDLREEIARHFRDGHARYASI